MKISKNHQLISFLKTPPLWKNTLYTIEQLPIFKPSINADIIETDINFPDNEVLGKRVERLFAYYIHKHPDYELIAQNIQIIDHKITIGELDFIIKNKITTKTIHVELVYKFYLYDPSIQKDLERWIGPNRKDRLIDKLHKLKEKQFPLLYRQQTKHKLQELDILPNYTWIQNVCFKANLFLPISYRNLTITPLNIECISGYYITLPEFVKDAYIDYEFYIPAKKYWIVDPLYNKNWMSFDELYTKIEKLLQQKRSPLLWLKDKEDQYFRLFIVWW